MKPRPASLPRLAVALIAALLGSPALAEKPAPATPPAAPAPPERKELWVPTKDLQKVLKDHPNAVMLTPAQYQALVRDAGRVKPPESDDRVELARLGLLVEGLRLKGKVEPGAWKARLTGELTVRVEGDAWAFGELHWPRHLKITRMQADGPVIASLDSVQFESSSLPAEPVGSLSLMVRGRGVRVLRFEAELPLYVRLRSGERALDLRHVGCGGSLELELPPGAALLPGSACERQGQVVKAAFDHRFVRRTDSGDPMDYGPGLGGAGQVLKDACRIRWTEAATVMDEQALRYAESADVAYHVTEGEVEATLSLEVQAQSGLEGRAEWQVTGPGAEVVGVTGADVLGWRQEQDLLKVTLQRSSLRQPVQVKLRLPWSGADTAALELPSLRTGLPMEARFSLSLAEGLDLLSVDGLVEKGTRQYFRLGMDAPRLAVRRALPRLEADVDVLVKLERDTVTLGRTLTLRSDRVLREVKAVLPAGEEFLGVECPAPGFEWKRVDRTLELRFPQGLTATQPATAVVTSKKKLAKAWSGPRIPETVALENLALPDAVKVAGYAALQFDDAWRVSLKETRGLEDRDARMTPVTGRMAWFGLRQWSLGFDVERAESVYSAEVTAYALPRARTVEIEGQLTLDISGAPLRSFQVKLTPAVARSLRITSPLVGEQKLDEASGVWTCSLRKESLGRPNIRFRISLPATAAGDENRVDAILPVLELPQARRFQGVWVVEANTDTQLSFEARNLQPLDVLRAPPVEGYVPRHRLVAAYTYGVGGHELKLSARQHEHSELALLLVRRLVLTSTLGLDGGGRHEVVAHLRHSGEQFVSLTLPGGARLLSAQVEHQAVKPVLGEDGALSLPLPANTANRANVRVRVLYELAGAPWAGAGRLALEPVRFPGNVPVLETSWNVHVPEGHTYSAAATRMQQEGVIPPVGWWEVLDRRAVRPGRPIQSSQLAQARAMWAAEEARRNQEKEFEARLDLLHLDTFQVENGTIADLVARLRELVALHPLFPQPAGRRIVLLGSVSASNKVSCYLRDVTLLKVVRLIEKLTYTRVVLKNETITFVPWDHGRAEMVVEAFAVPSDLESRARTLYQRLAPGAAVPADVWAALAAQQGIPWPAGSWMQVDMDRGLLLLRNQAVVVERIKDLIRGILFDDELGALGAVEDAWKEDAGAHDELARFLSSTRISKLVLNQASLSQALNTLHAEVQKVSGQTLPLLFAQPFDMSANVSLDVQDVSLVEALRYITELAGMKYSLRQGVVMVVPLSDVSSEMYTRVFRVPPDAAALLGGGSGNSNLPERARQILMEQAGIPFPEGSSASFNPMAGALTMRNTQPNLDMVSAFFESLGGAQSSGVSVSRAGLLPLELDLPTAGSLLRFHGAQSPETVVLAYASWERQVAAACGWLLAGAAAFSFWGRRRAGLRSWLAGVVLTAGPALVAPGWQPVANDLLGGWVLALGVWCLWCLLARGAAFVKSQESPAQEVTV